jgi:FAD/FMN-containing dehydrogenase
MFEAAQVAQATRTVVESLGQLEWITDARVERLSQDFYWFSPVLKRDLDGLRADAVVRPKTEEEIVSVISRCAKEGVPVTVRGSGTGNYGQCMPLHGGVILDLSAYNALLWQRGGVARAEAGIRLMDIEKQTQAAGYELRCFPSTWRSATLGGLYGGGFGGIGSINYGPLASTGNVLGARAITVEAEPKLVELRAPEALLLHHVYGTNGIVLELEIGLSPVQPWLEMIAVFESCDAALECANAIAHAPGIIKKSVSLMAAPIPDLLDAAVPWLRGAMPAGSHAVFAVLSEASEGAVNEFVVARQGRVAWRKTAEEVKKSGRTILETTWNHTTLHALKVDKNLTYIQTGFVAGEHLQQAKALHALLNDEVMLHLEFIRTKEGAMTCSGLQMVRYSTEARLNEIMQIHRDHGVYIANPHVFMVEDGKQGQINPDVVATKMRFDPQGLLNPGKLRGWEVRESIMADVAAGKISLATLPSF